MQLSAGKSPVSIEIRFLVGSQQFLILLVTISSRFGFCWVLGSPSDPSEPWDVAVGPQRSSD